MGTERKEGSEGPRWSCDAPKGGGPKDGSSGCDGDALSTKTYGFVGEAVGTGQPPPPQPLREDDGSVGEIEEPRWENDAFHSRGLRAQTSTSFVELYVPHL